MDVGAFALYAAAWIAAAGFLALKQPDDVVDAGVVMAAYGLILPGLTWLLTRGPKPAPTPVARPGPQLVAVLVFLALYAVLFTGYGLSAFHAAFPPSRGEFLGLIGLKLVAHVALPVLLLAALGGPLRPLFGGRADRRFWLVLVVIGLAQLGLMAVISHSLADIASLKFAAPMAGLAVMGTFLWMCLEAGFCEEFLFRAVLPVTTRRGDRQRDGGGVLRGASVRPRPRGGSVAAQRNRRRRPCVQPAAGDGLRRGGNLAHRHSDGRGLGPHPQSVAAGAAARPHRRPPQRRRVRPYLDAVSA